MNWRQIFGQLSDNTYYRHNMLRGVIGFVFLAGLYMLIYGLFVPARLPIVYNTFILTILGLQFLVIELAKRNHITIASLVVILPMYVALFFGYIYRPDVMMILMIPLLLTGMLINIRTMVLFAIVTVIYLVGISFFSFPDLRPLSEDEVIAFRIFVVIITYSLLTVLFAYHLYLMQKSEQHNLELQKRAYTLALQRRLTANMAHDFRTPITNIKTKAYLVRKLYERGEDITERLIALDEQINQMQSMMKDLDNLNQLDSTNNIEVSKKQINIVPLITKTIETQRSFATARQIVLLAQLPDTPVNVEGSEKLLRELFKTLLENAIIYNKDNGTVTIELTTEQNKAIFTIEDTGIGISSQYHEQIFERFFRVNAARTIETNVGTGIGLTIAKFVAESHKGTIAVDSVPDKGTTFTVRLPLAKNMT